MQCNLTMNKFIATWIMAKSCNNQYLDTLLWLLGCTKQKSYKNHWYDCHVHILVMRQYDNTAKMCLSSSLMAYGAV